MKKQKHFSHAGFLQFDIIPGSPDQNLRKVSDNLLNLDPPQNSLILLPELWATGFEYEKIRDLSQKTDWLLYELQKLADEYDIVIGGSLPEKGTSGLDESIYNTLFLTGKDGLLGRFRKQHLFSLWHEDDWFSRGNEPEIIETEYGCVGALVCFDLRFPEIARVQCQQDAELLIVSAQWPLSRYTQWRLLLQARAIENQIHVVACNASGACNSLELGGHSMIIDPNGEILVEANQKQGSGIVKLDHLVQLELRNRFNTVAPCPPLSAEKSKIIPIQQWEKVFKRRRTLGQEIVTIRFNESNLDLARIKQLQRRRVDGDFLVVMSAQNGEIVEHLASLACVDAVVVTD